MEVSVVYGVFPGRKVVQVMQPKAIEKETLRQQVLEDEELKSALERAYELSSNRLDGLFVVSEPKQVSVYQRENESFRRVL